MRNFVENLATIDEERQFGNISLGVAHIHFDGQVAQDEHTSATTATHAITDLQGISKFSETAKTAYFKCAFTLRAEGRRDGKRHDGAENKRVEVTHMPP